MTHGSLIHGYHFIDKANCDKVGKSYVKIVKGSYTCKKVKK